MSKLSFLASVSQTRSVLEQHGLMTKKALGQHFLINDGIVQRICDLAELTQEDKVIEVGPGIGTLSVALLQRAGKLIAIERDTDLPQVLAQTCKPWQDSFTLISGDALEVAPEDLSFAPNKLVSNLPYAVAATIVLDSIYREPNHHGSSGSCRQDVCKTRDEKLWRLHGKTWLVGSVCGAFFGVGG